MSRWGWAAFPVWTFLFTRAAILAFTSWSLRMDPRLHFEGPPLLDVPSLGGLCRWDCLYYTHIALEGYREPFWTNFFPLFPLLGKGLSLVTGLSVPHALVVLGNLAGLGALLAVYRVFLETEGEEVARAGLILFASFPFAFFQAAGYPESLMVLTSAGAMLLAMRGRHVAAGGVLGLGVLARHLTIVAGLSLLAAQVRERGLHPRRFLLHRPFLGLVLPFGCASLYMLYLGVTPRRAVRLVDAPQGGLGRAGLVRPGGSCAARGCRWRSTSTCCSPWCPRWARCCCCASPGGGCWGRSRPG